MQFQAKVHLGLPFKLNVAGMPERERYLRDDWFWMKEPETIAWIDSFEQNTIFWDVGANIGCYSLYAASLGRVAKTYAFEPFFPNFKALQDNIDANGWQKIIKSEQIALSNECGMANFASKSHEIGSSGGQIGDTKQFLPQNAYPVEVTTGDAYALLYGCPNYVKIDVDGQEDRVIAGLQRILADKALKSLLMEYNSPNEGANNYILSRGFVRDAELERLKLRYKDFNRIYRR